MTTLVLNSIESSTTTSAAYFEPDEKWKSGLKVDIENNLRSMVTEAKQNLNDTSTKAPVSTFERERLTEVAPIKSIRNVAEEQFRIPLECEIKVKTAQSSSSLQSSANTSEPRTFGPTPEHATWPPQELSEVKHDLSRLASREREHVPRDTNKGRASIAMGSSTSDMADRGFERPKHSPSIDKLDDAPRFARSAMDAHERGLFWPASHSSRPVLPESWLPSTPEEDTPMSHTFTNIARRGSAASASSFWAPSVLNIPSSTDPHDVTTDTKERGRDRISAMEQEWSAIYRARDRRRTASYTHTEAQTSSSTFERLDERNPPPPLSYSVAPSPYTAVPAARYSCSSGSLSSTVPTGYSNSSDSPSSTVPTGYSYSLPSSQVPLPSASRPIAIKKLFSLDDDSFQSSPSPKDWDVPSRSPYEPYHEFPDSPQTPDELPRSWPSSSFRTRLSSQDMRYGLYHTQHVHMYDGVHDDFDWCEYDERSIRQREESFRRREEEISLREQELKRREDVIREEEVKQKEREEKEAKRVDDEIMCKELDIINQEEGAKTREAGTEHEGAGTKLKEKHTKTEGKKAEMKEVQDKRRVEDLRQREEPAARRLVEEDIRMTRDVLRKSEEAKRKEDEVRLKEEASRATEEKIRRKEEELAQREGALLRREAEASSRHHQQKVQQEELRKRAETRRQSVEEKTKQGWKFWGHNPPDPNRTTPPPGMSTSRSFSSSTGPGPPNRNERVLAASSPTNRDRSTSIGTSHSSTTRISLTRLSSTANSQRSSTPKTQMPSAQKNSPRQMPTSRSSSSMGPCPTPNSNELHMSAANLPTDRGRTSTSRRAATWTSSTRLSWTESLRPPSTPKPQTPSAHKNTPRQMSTSRSPSSSARPWPIPNRNELHMPAANSHRGHPKSTNTSRSNTPWTSSTRLSSLPSAQSSSIPKPQKLSAQKSAPPRISSSRSVSSSTTKPWPIPSRNDLHMPATSSPTYNSRSKSTSTSPSTTWSYSTRPILTSQPSSTPKSQTPPSQQNNKVAPGAILLNVWMCIIDIYP
ncbi:hypothetical protein DEU56DRAFT_286352 [Suillus clintonianus]|uniref:uncharacterized protein n=1 Tax=Suillus clintonianus TaxID=1904413 RepID=UPI001B87D153|nr:uncharacterized protein DEU56DRAFT_286352 [Suillus clintonianus]KAG2140612.1 hypothetical protein DEU56DRAFT_286352 [Suillus clintonianus]